MSPTVDIVIPVFNEARVLEKNIQRLREHVSRHIPYNWNLVIVDNGSTDCTNALAHSLAQVHSDIRHISLPEPGRGRALRHAWSTSAADVCCYTDVDLSTDLAHLRPLLDAIIIDKFDISVGSRLLPESRVRRGLRRELISRAYNGFVRAALDTHFSDAQCGFKAVSRSVIQKLLPLVKDQEWFLDTELLVIAEKSGWKIKEIPVQWDDDDDSRVKVIPTAWQDIKGVMRLRQRFLGPRS